MKEILKQALTESQVSRMKQEYGDNSLSTYSDLNIMKMILSNLNDPIIKILIVALFANLGLAIIGKASYIDTIGIFIAVMLVTIIGTFAEYKSNKKFNTLQEEASKIIVKVYRNVNDKIQLLNLSIDEICVNDLVLLQTGDMIPADGYLVDGNLSVQQSALNGEFDEAEKEAHTSTEKQWSDEDMLNIYSVFRGSIVMSGNAIMKVVSIGEKTILGNINKHLQNTEQRETPLQVKLGVLANHISIFGYIGGISIATLFIGRAMFLGHITGYDSGLTIVINSIILGIIIIIMAVPEGLPLMVTIVNSINMKKMLEANVLVRKQEGIETAGSINILFSDKTGTITTGELNVQDTIDLLNKDDNYVHNVILRLMGLYNNDASYNADTNQIIGGNATDRAIMKYTLEYNKKQSTVLPEVKVINKIPFNSTDKYSLTTLQLGHDKGCTVLIKGMPEKIIEKCNLDDNAKQYLSEKFDKETSKCRRLITYAFAEVNEPVESLNDLKEIKYLTTLSISDTIRPESITAIKECQNAQIQVVMITGDKLETAKAIAKEAHIMDNKYQIAIDHDTLAKMSDKEVKDILPRLAVVARALPDDKLRLVALSQELNLVVAMTGDGVNDSPALKKADVGFAMGGGTEVAKEASEIIILDNNFYSIRNAILYGRTIYKSIQKFIKFQLGINISAVFISAILPFFGIEEPLTVTQILWVNLVMDTLGALAFGGEPALDEYLLEPPKQRDEKILTKQCYISLGNSFIYTAVPIILYATTIPHINIEPLKTWIFTYFILSSVLCAFLIRGNDEHIFKHIEKNKLFIYVMGLITVIQLFMTEFGGEIMNCHGLNLIEYLTIISLLCIIFLSTVLKGFVFRHN